MTDRFHIRSIIPFVFCLFPLILLPASLVAQNEFLPTLGDTISPAPWLYAGPFSVGAREGIIGVIPNPESYQPKEGDTLFSILPQGGAVDWKKTAPDSSGWVNLQYENVWWDTLMDIYGVAGIVDAGYAYAEFENAGRERALVIAERIGTFYLNGKSYYGDPYGYDVVRTPVVLEEGINRVMVQVSGYGDHRFLFKLIPADKPVSLISKEATLPDIIAGEKQKTWVGITVLNTTNQRLRDVRLTVGDGKSFKENQVTIPSLFPLCVKKIPISIEPNEPLSGMDTVSIPVKVSYKNNSSEDRLILKVREKGKTFKETFISKIDHSCQYYAVLPPKDYDPGKKYALIMTLHGAGVEASGQIDCYAPKDWAFVVAPTNRQRFGFDWQDWGRLDALEVLDLVKEKYPIDTNRVYLTGHSMGGHGTWHIALAHPDLFAAAAPEAGWTCFQLYIPWFLQKSYMFAEPGQIAIRDMSLREDFTPDFVENAKNLPLFIEQGGSDNDVPPVHARLFVSLLDQLGYQYQYKEIPGKPHWYEVDTLNHILCVDDPDLMNFLKEKKREPFPHQVNFKTSDLGQTHKNYWVDITEQEKPFYESRIETDVKGNQIEIKTVNILQFELSLSKYLLPYGEIGFLINGENLTYKFRTDERLSFFKNGDRFQIGKFKSTPMKKTPEFYGPIKQAYFFPFVLVFGTKGDSTSTDITLHQTRLEAARWWRVGNGYAEILPDTEVTKEVMENYNLILFGGPEENSVTAQVNKNMPIQIRDNKIFLDKSELYGDGMAVEFIYPNPLNLNKFVFIHEGTDLDGLKLSSFFNPIYSGAGLPDFMIFGDAVKLKGWGGIRAAGYFDTNWKLNLSLSYEQK
jgi:pimeloyl-ACP methyl ester carboxylesterase